VSRPSAAVLLATLVDEGSFEPWDGDIVSGDPLRFVDTLPYDERLERATESSGASEALLTGRASVRGHQIAVLAGEFGFLAGTMGLAAAERLVRAFERATAAGLPVLGLPVSGGTRMQEGTPAFVQMASAAAAAHRHRAAGLPYLVYLRDPTTGGVLASWGSLGQVTFAEPGALVGLTGPRVIELLTGAALPAGVQVAEHLHRHGHVDALVAPAELADRFAAVLAVAAAREPPEAPVAVPLELPAGAAVDPWAAVQRSRRTDRPGIRELLAACASDLTVLRGDGAGRDDPACLAALARVAGTGVVVVGHDRRPGERGGRVGPAGFRKAQRAMRLADELGLPLVTVIDTAGAEISRAAEEGGLAREIAACLATMSSLEVPTLALLLGEGAGGGAIAFLPADRIVAAEHAWLAPIQPEGAAAILHRTTARAAELAAAQAIASTDLRRLGVVDVVVADRPQPGEEGAGFGQRVAATAAAELRALTALDAAARLPARERRWRRIRAAGRGPAAPRPRAG
jgi:acyl-CoA carboxylase subunit beta